MPLVQNVYASVKFPELWPSSGLGSNTGGSSACVETQVENTTKFPEAEMPRVADLDLEPRARVSHLLCPS